ncbi:MAG: N,N-dimethylformamidase beta subunit family domain-containing protein, partial [Nitrososphaeraceae archaeon]
NLIKNPGPKVDLVPPLLAITNPTFNSTIPHKRILVEGTAFDPGLGVKQVEVLSQTYPLDNNTFNYKLATPGAAGNWSTWTIPIIISSIGPHRILAMATDMAGNQNWAEVTVNVPFVTTPSSSLVEDLPKHRVAFVQPSFTAGAYNVGGFYTFYPMYASVNLGSSVTTNLRNLTAVIPEVLADEKFYGPLNGQIKQFAPETLVSIIRDEDVHNGYIFGSDGRNAYDVLFLLHDEYATPSSYDNFKRFVSNGGTIVFLDGNVFYAQVAYNKNMHTVTLVKGHDWEFNGTAATKSVHERYFNETKQWVGSNFLYSDINLPIPFENNPFNYTHFEENYVNNPIATILLDYGAQHVYRDDKARTPVKVATYELDYGKGKVIMIGLYGQNLVGNQEFLRFFDHIVLPHSFGHIYKFTENGNEFGINWWINTGNVTKVERDRQSNALVITLGRSEQKADNLVITLPRKLTGAGDPSIYNFTITVDGKKVPYNRTSDDIENGLAIPLTGAATNVQISTTANVEIAEGATKPNNANFFAPAIINITRGTTIIWTNNDNEIHTVTYGDPDSGGPKGTLFDSGAIPSGRSFQHTFKDSGNFDYYCTLHPFMTGRVIVK